MDEVGLIVMVVCIGSGGLGLGVVLGFVCW